MSEYKGNIIKNYLDEKGISVVEFANKIGVSRQSVYLIFGRKNLDKNLQEKLSIIYPDLNLQNNYSVNTGKSNSPIQLNDSVGSTPTKSDDLLREELRIIRHHLSVVEKLLKDREV